MYYFTKYTYQILDCYRTHLELIDTVFIGFTGVASEIPPAQYTHAQSEDMLFFAASVDFTATDVGVRIRSISPQYEWMANDDPIPLFSPIGAVAGIATQALPVLPLISPFFVSKNGKLQHSFQNSVATPVTDGQVTWRMLRLSDPIQQADGSYGWSYKLGFKA